MRTLLYLVLFSCIPLILKGQPLNGNTPPYYKNFTVSVYTRAYEVRDMADLKKLQDTWDLISSQVKIDKIYLETHRDLLIVDEKTLESAIGFFRSKGLKVA